MRLLPCNLNLVSFVGCASVLALTSGCATQLKLHYASYTPPLNDSPDPVAAKASSDAAAAAVMASAANGAQIFPLARTNIFVVPTATLTAGGARGGASQQPSPTRAQPAAAAKPGNGGTKPATGNGDGPGATNAPTPVANPFATATIGKNSWSAIAVPIPDDGSYLTVTGTNNLFHTDTLSIGHPDNSDLVSSLNSKAVNNTSTLISTAAGLVAAFLPLAAGTGSAKATLSNNDLQAAKDASAAQQEELRPTWIRVPDEPVVVPTRIDENNGKSWYYTLDWTAPAGTVSLAQFLDGVKGKDVAVFPVPACIVATLTLYHDTTGVGPGALLDASKRSAAKEAEFFVTVETPNTLRPYQVPAVGTVTMGSICGATSTDNSPSVSDATQEILKSLSAAATTINGAKNKKDGAANSSKPAASSSNAGGGK